MIVDIIQAKKVQINLLNENNFIEEEVISKILFNEKEFNDLCNIKNISKLKMFVIYFFELLEKIEEMGWDTILSITYSENKENPQLAIKDIQEKIDFFKSLLEEFKAHAEFKEDFEKLIKEMSFEVKIKHYPKPNKVLKNVILVDSKLMLEDLDEYWFSNEIFKVIRDIAKYILENNYLKKETLKRDFPKYYNLNNIKNF